MKFSQKKKLIRLKYLICNVILHFPSFIKCVLPLLLNELLFKWKQKHWEMKKAAGFKKLGIHEEPTFFWCILPDGKYLYHDKDRNSNSLSDVSPNYTRIKT